MAETEDSVLPILRRIQTDLADLKRETRDGFSELRGSIRDLSERMDSFEGYFTYQMGLTVSEPDGHQENSKRYADANR